jgi:hydrogenase maturation protease
MPVKTVVIGLGGDCRGDDAAGLEVVRLLRGSLPPSVVIVESAGDPADLIESWTGADLTIVIDAVSSGAEPGSVWTYADPACRRRSHAVTSPESASLEVASPETAWPGGMHTPCLADAVRRGRALDRLPEALIVIGIEGGDFTPGASISPPVRASILRTSGIVRRCLWRVSHGGMKDALGVNE